MNSKVLIFITRYLCYASNEAFADRIAASLKCKGIDVEICNIINNKFSEVDLTKYIGKKYKAVIDFNSTLPRAMVGDKRFLDLIDAPFLDYIVDHPLYHHPILSIPLKNFYVICVDRNHKEYVKKHYPHIKDAFFLPLYASVASCNISYKEKKNKVLFSGTYYDPIKYQSMINEKSKEDRDIIWNIIDILKNDSSILIEDAFERVTRDLSDYATKLNSLYLADIYTRAVSRKKVIDSFLDAGIKLTILGNEWEYYDRYDELEVIEGLDYIKSLNVIASCKFLLNVMPGFRYGSHDRILTGMINGVVVISDSNKYLDSIFKDNELITYNIDNIQEEAFRIKKIIDACYSENVLFNSDLNVNLLGMASCKINIEEIAYKGKEIVLKSFSYDNHADKLIYILTEL